MAKGTNPDTQTERDQGQIQGCRYFVGTSIKTQGRRYDLPPLSVPVARQTALRDAKGRRGVAVSDPVAVSLAVKRTRAPLHSESGLSIARDNGLVEALVGEAGVEPATPCV